MGADIIEHAAGEFSRAVFVKGGSGDPSMAPGTVNSVTAAPTTFVVSSLAGYGDDYFNGWYVFVVWDSAGGEAAPQGESKVITDYVSATGTFSHAVFTVAMVAGDKVLVSLSDPNAAAGGGTATLGNQTAIITDTEKIYDVTLGANPVAGSLAAFIASGGTALGTELYDSCSLIDALGVDGNDALSHDFSEESLMAYAHGKHDTTYILFIIPEAVASITATNAKLQTDLATLGRVITITQADALTHVDFPSYTVCVLGSDQGAASWTTSNLASIKTVPNLITICCDARSAAYLKIGTDGGDAGAKTSIVGVANIEGSMQGTGIHGHTGLAVGANTIAAAGVTISTLDMSDADITETWFAYESVNANTDVVLGRVCRTQVDGTIGIDADGAEIEKSIVFYGAAYSYDTLNSLGQDVMFNLVLIAIHATTVGQAITLSGDIGDLQKKILGNMTTKFGTATPMAKFIAGTNVGLGEPMPNSTSIRDLLGNFTGPYDAAAQDDNVKASLDLAHTAIGRHVSMMEFWSEIDDIITFTTATTNVAFPSIVVSDIPAGATIIHANCMMKPRAINNTFASVNAINGDIELQVKENIAGAYTNAIKLNDNALSTTASTKEGGLLIISKYDCSGEVDGNDTYTMRTTGNTFVDGNNLELIDVVTGIRIYFTA